MQLARLSLALMALGTICCCSIVSSVTAFTGPAVVVARQQQQHRTISSLSVAANGEHDDSGEIVARRIVVKGDVQGGYYRSCVLNEAGKFRRLVGTMSPPDETDEAEIYVEGKRNLVDGFVRWCKRSKVGMNQLVTVKDVHEEEPTGLYEGFYAKTK